MQAGRMTQIELFGAGELTPPEPPRPVPPHVVIRPERIRRWLGADLALVRRAEVMPWAMAWEVNSRTRDFAGLAGELGAEEAAEWVAHWDAEMARLRAARDD